MKKVRPSYTAGVVLVCANQRDPDAKKPSCGLERGTALRGWLKDRIKAEHLKGEILSSRTTCLGICSRHGVTVDIVPTPGHGERVMVVVDPEADREALWARIKASLVGDGSVPSLEEIPDDEL